MSVDLLVGWSVGNAFAFLPSWAVFASLHLPNCKQLLLPCIQPCYSKKMQKLYRVFHIKCNILKRHISASSNVRKFRKKAFERYFNADFYEIKAV